jgi:hypothetical protein
LRLLRRLLGVHAEALLPEGRLKGRVVRQGCKRRICVPGCAAAITTAQAPRA